MKKINKLLLIALLIFFVFDSISLTYLCLSGHLFNKKVAPIELKKDSSDLSIFEEKSESTKPLTDKTFFIKGEVLEFDSDKLVMKIEDDSRVEISAGNELYFLLIKPDHTHEKVPLDRSKIKEGSMQNALVWTENNKDFKLLGFTKVLQEE